MMDHNILSQEQILYRQIDQILWQDWDPIGINDCADARNEYSGYLPHVWRFKIQNTDPEIITQYLFKIETENMGLFGNIENCKKVAEKIISL